MATIQDLRQQAIEIGFLVDKVRDNFTTRSRLQYYRDNPEQLQAKLSEAAAFKSKALVLWDMDRAFGTLDILPNRETLMAGRTNTWLQAGDIVAGWLSYLADQPRVIEEVTLTGYRWHWLNNPSTVYGPGFGPQKLDKWLQSHGWIKLSGTDIDSIYTEQQSELDGLRSFLQA